MYPNLILFICWVKKGLPVLFLETFYAKVLEQALQIFCFTIFINTFCYPGCWFAPNNKVLILSSSFLFQPSTFAYFRKSQFMFSYIFTSKLIFTLIIHPSNAFSSLSLSWDCTEMTILAYFRTLLLEGNLQSSNSK